MENRERNIQLKIRLTEKERNLFEEKMRKANCKTMSHFIRRCVLEKEINVVDLNPFRDLQWEISKVGNNINQIAKVANTNAIIYKNDIKKMQEDLDNLSKSLCKLYSELLKSPKKKESENNGNY